MNRRALFALFIVSQAVIGCSDHELAEPKTAAPKSTPFGAALASHYLRYAADQQANDQVVSSTHFADKGLKAAYGQVVMPEDVSTLADGELINAREQLVTALSAERQNALPKASASAQFYFDCWADNAATKADAAEGAHCKESFTKAMAQIEKGEEVSPAAGEAAAPAPAPADATQQSAPTTEVAQAPVPAPEAAKEEAEKAAKELKEVTKEEAPKEEPKAEEEPQQCEKMCGKKHHAKQDKRDAYLVMFGMDQDALTPAGSRVMDEIAKELAERTGAGYTVAVNGHTDTVATNRYNLSLSNRRAEVVRRALIARGIPDKSIRAFGFGETDLAVPTPDETPEAKNRRTEIYIGEN